MKSKNFSTKDKKTFCSDFTTILTLSLVSNTKGLSLKEKQHIKACLREKKVTQALKIIEKKYSMGEWKNFVEAHAAPLIKQYA
jgi:hypothetical protein